MILIKTETNSCIVLIYVLKRYTRWNVCVGLTMIRFLLYIYTVKTYGHCVLYSLCNFNMAYLNLRFGLTFIENHSCMDYTQSPIAQLLWSYCKARLFTGRLLTDSLSQLKSSWQVILEKKAKLCFLSMFLFICNFLFYQWNFSAW